MVQFRPASENDAQAIAALHAKSWQQNYRGALSDEFLDNEAPPERLKVWESRLKNHNPNQIVIVAENDQKIIGFVCAFLNHNQEFGSLVDNLHVASHRHGEGIGCRLMNLAAKEIDNRLPNSNMYLWVLEQNKGAIKFYEALGGKKIETVEEIDIGDQIVIKSRYYWKSLYGIIEKEKDQQ